MEGGVVQLAVDFQEDVAQQVKARPLLRLESSPVVGPEADTSDEMGRAGFGEEGVARVSSSCWRKGRVEHLARLPLQTMS